MPGTVLSTRTRAMRNTDLVLALIESACRDNAVELLCLLHICLLLLDFLVESTLLSLYNALLFLL